MSPLLHTDQAGINLEVNGRDELVPALLAGTP
jgi:hypothetical protein